MAGAVKSKKAARHATSDWMKLEQERGISVTSSVMQFCYQDYIVNLLDTPGHADFSEDTYRTLTAVDSALMVIDCAKGVEQRTTDKTNNRTQEYISGFGRFFYCLLHSTSLPQHDLVQPWQSVKPMLSIVTMICYVANPQM